MAITSQMVKDLRASTGAGMMDCKKALDEANGDMDAAIDWLRKKGLAAAAKKASRVASEGLVAVKTSGAVGAVIEVNSETDFVSRNEEFQGFVRTLADIGTNCDSLEALMEMPYTGASHSVAEELTNKIAKIGENMSIRRVAKLSVDNGVVVSYIHNAVAEGMGKIGVLVGLSSAADAGVLEQLGRQIAMHIAATAPATGITTAPARPLPMPAAKPLTPFSRAPIAGIATRPTAPATAPAATHLSPLATPPRTCLGRSSMLPITSFIACAARGHP